MDFFLSELFLEMSTVEVIVLGTNKLTDLIPDFVRDPSNRLFSIIAVFDEANPLFFVLSEVSPNRRLTLAKDLLGLFSINFILRQFWHDIAL